MTEQQIVKKNERYTVEIVDLSYEGISRTRIYSMYRQIVADMSAE